MVSSSQFRTGLFVLGGLLLLLVTLFFLGLSDLFVRKANFVTLFSESVQGLDIGSPVKYKGVPIGRVKAITIQIHDKLIRVDMEIEEKAFAATPGYFGEQQESERAFREFFDRELANGLQIRLNYAGITGLKYIEMDYYGAKASDIIPRPEYLSPSTIYVPAVPSIFTDMLRTISVSLENISKIQFGKISDEFTAGLNRVNVMLNDPAFSALLSNVESISAHLDDTLSRVNRVLDVVGNLMRYLNEDPAALLRGKNTPALKLKDLR